MSKRQLYVNLAVEDLDRSIAFFTKLGFSFDPTFTDETATCMVVGDAAYIMLLTKDKFAEFTPKPLVDSAAETEVLIALSAESAEAVDEIADLGLESGGAEVRDPMDYGSMYARSFQDPDGHIWEVVWMNEAAIADAQTAGAAATPGT